MTPRSSQNTENAKVTDGMASKSAKAGGRRRRGGRTRRSRTMKSIAEQDRHHRRHRLPDQPAGLERRHRSRARRRSRQGLRRRRRRGQEARRTLAGRRAGNRQSVAGSSVKQAERAGSLLTEMVPSIRKTSDLVQEIAAASSEQSLPASARSTARWASSTRRRSRTPRRPKNSPPPPRNSAARPSSCSRLMTFFRARRGRPAPGTQLCAAGRSSSRRQRARAASRVAAVRSPKAISSVTAGSLGKTSRQPRDNHVRRTPGSRDRTTGFRIKPGMTDSERSASTRPPTRSPIMGQAYRPKEAPSPSRSTRRLRST
jgi:methyl-accepting chemotaxis protein